VSAFRADDRVLLLAVPALDTVVALARILSHGVLVAMAPRDVVDQGRQALSEFENVMFIEIEGQRIPWRDAYFTKIVADEEWSTNVDVARVLAPGGEIIAPQTGTG
jgi:hypothetical protein